MKNDAEKGSIVPPTEKTNEIKKENNVYKSNLDEKIILNSMCYCKNYFYDKEKISLIYPCNHFVHEKCINDYVYLKIKVSKNKNLCLNVLDCPFCKTPITSVITDTKIKKNKKLLQYKTDLESLRMDVSGFINYPLLPMSIVKFGSFMNKLISSHTENDLLDTAEIFFKCCNIKINVIDNTKNNPIQYLNNTITWKNKKDASSNIVLISNHVNYLDSFVIYYLFKSGFVSSEFINKTDIGRIIASKCNLLIFNRSKDTNMVEKIKKYLEEKHIITMYPEGAMGNHKTLLRFRTGAFYVGAPVCPIIIKYNPFIWDDDLKTMIFKLTTQTEIIIDVIVNDLIYPPFDNQKIDEVRNFMAKVGNLKLSRVSNKSIQD
jgi:1-acyl-sn-glycerol-3-phosphate acyltransferase